MYLKLQHKKCIFKCRIITVARVCSNMLGTTLRVRTLFVFIDEYPTGEDFLCMNITTLNIYCLKQIVHTFSQNIFEIVFDILMPVSVFFFKH